jgi:hypothetical protein
VKRPRPSPYEVTRNGGLNMSLNLLSLRTTRSNRTLKLYRQIPNGRARGGLLASCEVRCK